MFQVGCDLATGGIEIDDQNLGSMERPGLRMLVDRGEKIASILDGQRSGKIALKAEANEGERIQAPLLASAAPFVCVT